MTWRHVARQDATLTVGARSVKVLLGILAFGVLIAGYIYPVTAPDPITTARFPGYVHGLLDTLVPFVGVLLGYNAVAGDRESGAIRLALSLPQSREDLVAGTYLSRTGLLSAALVLALVGAGALVVYPFGELDLVPFLLFVALTVAFGAVWSGLGVAVSLAVATKRRALVLGFAVLFLFVIAWDAVFSALTLGLNAAGVVDGPLPDPVQFVFGLEPGRLFGRLTAGFVDPSRPVEGAWYLNEWVALGLLALWLVGPMGLGYLRFSRGDIA